VSSTTPHSIAERPVGDGELRVDRQTAPLEIEQELLPGLRALADAVGKPPPVPSCRGADDHEQTLRVVFEPSLDVDAIGPHVDVPLAGQVANGPSTKLRFENPDVYNSIAALAAKPLIRIVLPIVN
jgi:hypothetical protein